MDFVTFANTNGWMLQNEQNFQILSAWSFTVWINSYSLVSFVSFKDTLSSASCSGRRNTQILQVESDVSDFSCGEKQT